MDNKYSLLNFDMDSKDPDLTERDEVAQEIDKLLWEFLDKYEELSNRYPDAGLGDTATDEAVAHEFYDVLHYGCLRRAEHATKTTKH